MNKTLIRKAEVARERMRPTGTANDRTARRAHELRAAATSRVPKRAIKPDLKFAGLRASAAAAGKQLRKG